MKSNNDNEQSEQICSKEEARCIQKISNREEEVSKVSRPQLTDPPID